MKSRESLIRVRRFQVDEKRRQAAQVEMMIAEFMRMIGDLDDQIVIEQNRVGIHDVTHFAYPTFARAAMQRRDNLKVSVRDLEEKLADAQAELAEAIEDLKKVELIEERDQQRDRDARDQVEQEALDDMAGRRHAFGR
ncbi:MULTISPECIES: flagellar FliJ family protein [Hyphomicrobiales]|mgnify:CR=1 FL=1|jgi:flagellar FliJ protein|uniref:Flagellar export protein FliJ n=2 Tax=Prosthecodimorpha TaxID=2981530 RepID=A0A0P6VT35_9HYPH|nr:MULTISPECIES: flagellar FliJ family protein [Hyphomicrobiales]KPL54402.1 flagellar export protein FliJ [Prosthecomicrobium hirschii]MBT9289247.1 flagellar FliJ family protein [Prosthecodimorpha staleyi]MCW1840762.1 flagellar FliJ family protein [Prosthecomicrobium hirschii]TPQ51089.1 flagellar export protein FliJ [Prosthecomicrobium hirschii]